MNSNQYSYRERAASSSVHTGLRPFRHIMGAVTHSLLLARSAIAAEPARVDPQSDVSANAPSASATQGNAPTATGTPSDAPSATGTQSDVSTNALTQPTSDKRDGVVLPRAVSTPVDYPSENHLAASVLVEITVDAEGRASNPKLLDGAEPFATATLAAMDRWRFTPATRNGVPVAARIRFIVRFVPPREQDTHATGAAAKALVPPDLSPNNPPKQRGKAKPTPELEVTVQGEHPEAAVVSMGRSDVEQMPGAFGDPFRAIDALPGITPIVSGLPFFFIRGAPPGNQGYFFDGIRVPLLYHLAAGPSVINPALVDRVDLYAGGYPARYGRFAGAIVAGESRDPPPEYHAQGSIRLVDSGGYVSAPLGRGAVALSGRYSYTGAVVSLIVPQIKLEYWDYQAKVVQYLSNRDTVSLLAFGALDLLQDKTNDSAEGLLGTEFHRVDLRYQRNISPETRLRTSVTLGLDKTLAAGAMTVRDRLVAARSTFDHRVGEQAQLRIGLEAAVDGYDVILPIPDGSNVRLRQALPERTDMVTSVWADLPFQASRNLSVVPGLRVDHYWSSDAKALSIEPRVAATFTVRKNLRIVHAFGLAQQPPSFVVPVPGFQVSGLKQGLQRSVQSSAGVELDLPSEITAGATLFQNAFFNLTDQLSAINRPTGEVDKIDLAQRARGRTFGAELLIRRSFSQRIGGMFAYTISKSWRTIDGVRVPAAFDRRHVLQAALAFNLGRNWRTSVRGMYYSGVPSHASDGEGIAVGNGEYVRRNAEYLPRVPAYWRLDLRLQKRWSVGNKGAYWAMTFEVLNATLNREAISQFCGSNGCNAHRMGPVTIPSIGIEAAY